MWKPIESAPTNGDSILAYQYGEQIVVYYLKHPEGFGGWYEASCDAAQIYPSHWMPLSAPPISAASSPA